MMCESCSGFGSKQSAQCMVRGLTPELSRPAATTVSVRRNTRPGGSAEAAKRVRLERVVMRIHALVTSRYDGPRSEEHTSELHSLMRIQYAVFCLKKKTK